MCVLRTPVHAGAHTDTAVGSGHGAPGTPPHTPRALLALLQSISTPVNQGTLPRPKPIGVFAEGVLVDGWHRLLWAPFSREESGSSRAALGSATVSTSIQTKRGVFYEAILKWVAEGELID